MLSVELLVATMNQSDFSLIERLNIQTNAIIINQCDCYEYHEIKKTSFIVKWFNVNERGLSKSRNIAFSKATADICLLVDDDEVMKEGYEQLIVEEFNNNTDADIITFNLLSIDNMKQRYINKDRRRLHFFNIMRYGSARIAFRRQKVENARILFAPNFGAGTEISCGEDSLFLHDCLLKKMHIYSSPSIIADIDDQEKNSSWFKGYTENYFLNMGMVFAALSPHYANLWILQYLLRHKKITKDLGLKKCFSYMQKGKRLFKKM